MRFTVVVLSFFVTSLFAFAAHAEGSKPFVSVSDSDLLKGHRGAPSTWPMYGGSYGQERFSDLDQINRGNVKNLKPAWTFHTGVYNMASGYQTTPIVHNGDMYITSPRVGREQWLMKLDARTGEEIWRKGIRIGASRYCCGPNNRGATIYKDKVYLATLDARLIAFDPENGDVIWETSTGESAEGYSQTCAPVAFDDKLFIGVAGGEFGIRGYLKAFDAHTGKLLWTWHTIPSPEEGGWYGDWQETAPGIGLSLNRNIAQEKADMDKYPDAWKRGGVPIWTTPSLDPERRLIYVTTGNPGPDYDASVRPGDNLWGDSLCAIRIDDGTLTWGFQYVPHDVWDYDGGTPPLLFDAEIDGVQTPVVGLFTKLGYFYLLDRRDGTLLKVSEPYVPQENLFTHFTEEGTRIAPGSAGGTNWSPASYNPTNGLVYSVNIHWPMMMTTQPDLPYKPGTMYQGGNASFSTKGVTIWGNVLALNPVTGKIVWKTKTDLPMFSGVITTAGGLVFAGQSDASFDAWDADTGELLWHFPTAAGCNAAPITYMLDGKQYVTIVAGGSRYTRRSRDEPPEADAIITFALP
ncbi:MAG: PQQ-binding-like beta-propeller repeat protein [Candidatus Hydrogenedentes bacterium]|nr:PQQ-binding-like beta-propeller repeat protein [Candidatus Hydrogenedentota bacterium]